MAGRGSPKKRMLPTRKGSRIHKGVDSGSNFAALRNQADLGQVMREKLETSKVNVILLAPQLADWQAINWHQVNRRVRQLRQRIYRASVAGALHQVCN